MTIRSVEADPPWFVLANGEPAKFNKYRMVSVCLYSDTILIYREYRGKLSIVVRWCVIDTCH